MSMSDFDRRRKEFNEKFDRTSRAINFGFVVTALLAVGIVALAAWALVRVVLHFT